MNQAKPLILFIALSFASNAHSNGLCSHVFSTSSSTKDAHANVRNIDKKLVAIQSSPFIGEQPTLTVKELFEVFNPNSKNHRVNVDAIVVTDLNLPIEQGPVFITGIRYKSDKSKVLVDYLKVRDTNEIKSVIEIPMQTNGEPSFPISFVVIDKGFKFDLKAGEIPVPGKHFPVNSERELPFPAHDLNSRRDAESHLSQNVHDFVIKNPFLYSYANVNWTTRQVTLGEGKKVLLVADGSSNPGLSKKKIYSGIVIAENSQQVVLKNSLGLTYKIDKSSIDLSSAYVQESIPNKMILNRSFAAFAAQNWLLSRHYIGDDALTNIRRLRDIISDLREDVKAKSKHFGINLIERSNLQYLKTGDIIIGFKSAFSPKRSSDEQHASQVEASLYQVLKIVDLGKHNGYIEVIAPKSVVMRIPLSHMNQGYFLVDQGQ